MSLVGYYNRRLPLDVP